MFRLQVARPLQNLLRCCCVLTSTSNERRRTVKRPGGPVVANSRQKGVRIPDVIGTLDTPSVFSVATCSSSSNTITILDLFYELTKIVGPSEGRGAPVAASNGKHVCGFLMYIRSVGVVE